MRLTELDLALFRELQRDGRLPFTAIAAQLDVSESFVRRRVEHLRRTDVFSITAVANPRLLGLDFMAWIGLVVQRSRATSVAHQLVNLPDVDYVVQTAGRFNVMVEVACATPGDLLNLVQMIRLIPGVHRSETFLYLDITYQGFQWSIGDNRSQPVCSVASRPDVTDIELIRCLQVDGRAPYRKLAHILGISQREVSARFNRLIEEDVLRVIAVGDPRLFGFRAMAWLGIRLQEAADLTSVATSLSTVPGIDYVVIPSGRFDVMAELVCVDHDELVRRLEREVGDIKGISEIEPFVYLQLLYKSTAGAWGVGRSPAVPD